MLWGLIAGWGRCPGGQHGNPLHILALENPMDREAWQATVHGVAELDMTQTTHTFTLDFFNFIDRQFLTSVNTADFKFTIP